MLSLRIINRDAYSGPMGKILVLAVDRDDDFGKKGGVTTPVIGVERCKEAATALAMDDPEDSDVNALFAAIKECMKIREEGGEAEVALVCGDHQVGTKSDMIITQEFETVKNIVKPDGLILVGDGAEDEYIYPLISGVKIVSIRRVYVNQAPGLEGSLYILTKMLADPDKRRRFIAPIGLTLMLVSLFFVLPNLVMYMSDPDIKIIAAMSSGLCGFFVGLVLLIYGYSVGKRLKKVQSTIYNSMYKESTKFLFLIVAVAFVLISAVYDYLEMQSLYFLSEISKLTFFVESLVWPVVIALMLYIIGTMITEYQNDRVFKTGYILSGLTLAAYGLVITGFLDIFQAYISYQYTIRLGIVEVVIGMATTLVINYIRGRAKDIKKPEKKKKTIIRRKVKKTSSSDEEDGYDVLY